ncbi:MAG: DNA polymerase III subunit gamma/tau [Azoarcus sp.]|jgi:DNA polymerase-3 subunit gamma/tau|nr:DNA polymerase III subunit gamma/tau [Azoarcus sp.]
MSYQVLARKWRPKSFETLVGQEHVVRALSHALATGRLHHAWLFTGTRGVGKTTISRILAKALNCEAGVSATPCGQCDACRAIDADRFPDYVEMDAASNRGVDDMAALLDRAVYAPVAGRYKVYMIDEVHMLTGHAFNAMLKTLEEPPEHVKFILATTDPQKIPVTVLSRCLQFNLKQMPPGQISGHLARILEAESTPFEPGALRHLAHAASGSMRDALSLLDQAIAHGAGQVLEEQVTNMLGTVGDDHLYAILDALAAGDAQALIAVADGMEARSLSFDAALQALATLIARVALVQFAPAAVADECERAQLSIHAGRLDAEYLQLAYQIAIHGRDELALAPDEYTGFTMSLLRLLAFRPEQPPPGVPPAGGGPDGAIRKLTLPPVAEKKTAAIPPAPAQAAIARPESKPAGDVPPWEALPPEAAIHVPEEALNNALRSELVEGAEGHSSWNQGQGPVQPERAGAGGGKRAGAIQSFPGPASMRGQQEKKTPDDNASPQPSETAVGEPAVTAAFARADWRETVHALGLSGLARELAQHCEWLERSGDNLRLRLSDSYRHLLEINSTVPARIESELARALCRPMKLHIETGAIAGQTPAQRDELDRRERHAQAMAALECDPFVLGLIERFDASLNENTVKLL